MIACACFGDFSVVTGESCHIILLVRAETQKILPSRGRNELKIVSNCSTYSFKQKLEMCNVTWFCLGKNLFWNARVRELEKSS